MRVRHDGHVVTLGERQRDVVDERLDAAGGRPVAAGDERDLHLSRMARRRRLSQVVTRVSQRSAFAAWISRNTSTTPYCSSYPG